MRSLVIFVFCVVVSVLAAPQKSAPACDYSKCALPDCKCSTIPSGNDGKSPQFVVLSFDDSISKPVYNNFIEPIFLKRKNPDGCSISGTFFIPHEYTDYSVVNTLYGKGFEIASHSITKNFLQEYWRNATIDELQAELDGQRQILSKFGRIPKTAIIGARVPQLQLNRFTFSALQGSKFTYDSSWPTLQKKPFAPYTLDYQSTQPCHTVNCQEFAAPGLWEFPIVDWINQNGVDCNAVDACAVLGDDEVIFEWMKQNFISINRTGAPITFRINYSWFMAEPDHQKALVKFLDFIETQEKTYIVSHKQVLDWTKNPTGNFTSCQDIKPLACTPVVCKLTLNGSERLMTSCNTCPKTYPWLGNPQGV